MTWTKFLSLGHKIVPDPDIFPWGKCSELVFRKSLKFLVSISRAVWPRRTRNLREVAGTQEAWGSGKTPLTMIGLKGHSHLFWCLQNWVCDGAGLAFSNCPTRSQNFALNRMESCIEGPIFFVFTINRTKVRKSTDRSLERRCENVRWARLSRCRYANGKTSNTNY